MRKLVGEIMRKDSKVTVLQKKREKIMKEKKTLCQKKKHFETKEKTVKIEREEK